MRCTLWFPNLGGKEDVQHTHTGSLCTITAQYWTDSPKRCMLCVSLRFISYQWINIKCDVNQGFLRESVTPESVATCAVIKPVISVISGLWGSRGHQGCQIVQTREFHSCVGFVCRHWLLVTEDGHMVTARQEPRLVLMSLTCEGGQVCLNGPNMEELKFPVRQPDNPIINCRSISSSIIISLVDIFSGNLQVNTHLKHQGNQFVYFSLVNCSFNYN